MELGQWFTMHASDYDETFMPVTYSAKYESITTSKYLTCWICKNEGTGMGAIYAQASNDYHMLYRIATIEGVYGKHPVPVCKSCEKTMQNKLPKRTSWGAGLDNEYVIGTHSWCKGTGFSSWSCEHGSSEVHYFTEID